MIHKFTVNRINNPIDATFSFNYALFGQKMDTIDDLINLLKFERHIFYGDIEILYIDGIVNISITKPIKTIKYGIERFEFKKSTLKFKFSTLKFLVSIKDLPIIDCLFQADYLYLEEVIELELPTNYIE